MYDGIHPASGFYVHTCTKMRYKADFQPSYLLDPVIHPLRRMSLSRGANAMQTIGIFQEEYTWHPFCKPLLDKHAYVSFAHPERFHDVKPHQDDAHGSPPTASQSQTDSNIDGESNDNEDGSSEGDVDETYEEIGNISMSSWMNVMLATSIDNGDVHCVPAPVRHKSLTLRRSMLSLTNVGDACAYVRYISLSQMHPKWDESNFRQLMTSAVEGFGEELSREVIFYP